jgi:hypothetical protein
MYFLFIADHLLDFSIENMNWQLQNNYEQLLEIIIVHNWHVIKCAIYFGEPTNSNLLVFIVNKLNYMEYY